MSLQEALTRVSQIQQMASGPAAPTPAPAGQTSAAAATTPNTATTQGGQQASASSFAAALGKADAQGIPTAAYRAAQPVQNGQLVQSLFQPRQQAADIIAKRFGLSISSSYRTPEHNAEVGGVPNSYHTKGLAFDFTGSDSAMNAAKAWASRHPEMFKEVLVHDVGSGLHLHLAFRSS